MKPIRTFEIGSRVFFKGIEGFTSKDIDELNIMDTWIPQHTNVLNAKLHGKDVFFFKNMSKEEFIQDTLTSGVPMRIGKFLVPEFVKYLGMTIEDLKRLDPLVDKLDEKHKYEAVIYNSYIENGDFYLTDEQLNTAYQIYKEKR